MDSILDLLVEQLGKLLASNDYCEQGDCFFALIDRLVLDYSAASCVSTSSSSASMTAISDTLYRFLRSPQRYSCTNPDIYV